MNTSQLIAQIFREIPLLRFLIALVAGIYFHENFNFNILPITIVLCITSIIVCIISNIYKNSFVAVTQLFVYLTTFFFIGALLALPHHLKPITELGKRSEMTGYVTNVIKQNGARTRFEFQADTLITNNLLYRNYRGVITMDTAKFIPKVGLRQHLVGIVFDRKKTIDGEFDYSKYLEYNEIQFSAFAYKCDSVSVSRTTIWTITNQIREFVVNQLYSAGIEGENLHLLQAMLLGDKSQLESDVKQTFSDCGTIHILAVSGMHVGIIYGFISLITSRIFRKKHWLKFLVDITFIWMYALISGLASSIFRATLMMTFFGLSQNARTKLTTYNSLALSLLIILVVNPLSVYSSGLWLSFSAVLGIVGFHKKFEPFLRNMKSRIGRFCIENLIVSFFAQLATLPIILSQFHTFPTYFLINNFILVPLAAPVLILAIFTFIVSLVSFDIAWFIGYVDNIILSFMHFYAENASSLPYSVITDIRFDVVDAAILSFALILIGKSLYIKRFKLFHKMFYPLCAAVIYHFSIAVIQHYDKEIIQFQSYGKENLSVNIGGHFTHFLSDTSDVKALKLTKIIDRENRAITSEICQLCAPSTIEVGDSVIHVIPHPIEKNAIIKIMAKDDSLIIDP